MMKFFTKSTTKLGVLFLAVALLGSACSKKKKNNDPYANNNNYYGPNTSCGNPTNTAGAAYRGFATANLGRGGGVIDLDMFTMANGQIYAVGEIYIADLSLLDPAYQPGSSLVECVEGSGTFTYKSGNIGDEISMSLVGRQGSTILFGGQNPSNGMEAITVWVNDNITGQIHMRLGGQGQYIDQEMFTYTLSP